MPAGACCALPYRLCHVNGCRNRGNRWLAAVAMILAALVVSVPASAQSGSAYPTQTIKLIVPYAPGGSADFTARLISQKMSEGLRQTIVVDNKPGANGIIGATVVARAAPDGYTLLLAPRELAINPSIHATSPYDVLNSFAWIGVATEGHFVLVVNPSVNAHSLSELIALAKSAPGSLAYGSIGIGSVAQLNFEALKQQLSVDITHVPYKGAGPAIQATIGGEIGLTLSAIPGAIGFIRSGQLRALAVGSAARHPQLPDVPTLAEAGLKGDLFLPTFFGLAAPAGTPRSVIDKLNAEMRRALAAPEIVERLAVSGLTPVGGSPEEMATVIAKDVIHFGALVKAIGIKPE